MKPINLPTGTPPLLRLNEANAVFNISKSTLLRLRRTNVIRTYRTSGGQYMFYRDDLIEHISKNTNGNEQLQKVRDEK
jgi:excisionase family DNA binding protein